MTNRLGIQPPIPDAFRVLTLALGNNAGSISSGAGGLTNQIVVWYADGSPLGFFDPTEAGLIAALAATTGNDTIALPSVNIALGAAITIPVGVALVGLGEDSILTFAGFNGTAITGALGVSLSNFGLYYTGDGIGIDARFSNMVVDPRFVILTSGDAANIGVKMGA